MAGSSSFVTFAVLVLAAAVFSVGVSAQDFDMAPAPAPAFDKGAAAYSTMISGAVICSSLFFSVLALFKH